MNLTVVNKALNVTAVKVVSISGSSVFLVGDTRNINCSSVYQSSNSQSAALPTPD